MIEKIRFAVVNMKTFNDAAIYIEDLLVHDFMENEDKKTVVVETPEDDAIKCFKTYKEYKSKNMLKLFEILTRRNGLSAKKYADEIYQTSNKLLHDTTNIKRAFVHAASKTIIKTSIGIVDYIHPSLENSVLNYGYSVFDLKNRKALLVQPHDGKVMTTHFKISDNGYNKIKQEYNF